MQSQDNPDSKRPYGSVYKSNLTRSEIHLIPDKSTKDFTRIKVSHNKNNFGAKLPPFLVDIYFDNESVVIKKSNALTQQDQLLYEIKNYMLEQKTNGEELNQTNVINHFPGSMGRDKIRTLLDMGTDTHWHVSKGLNNSLVYDPIDDV